MKTTSQQELDTSKIKVPRPFTAETLQQELDASETVGPRPLTTERYWKRNQRPAPQPVEAPKYKSRGGKEVLRRQKLKTLYRLKSLAITKEEVNQFVAEIKEIRREQRRERRIRKIEKKYKND